MGASWAQFYQGRLLNDGYLDYFVERYDPFFAAIEDRLKHGDRVVEIGCGLATTTKLLKAGTNWCGYRCFDIDPEMIALAQLNLQDSTPVQYGDARKPTGVLPDIIHSHGLLEHFSDEDIFKVLKAHDVDSPRYAIHYVPGDKYESPSFGDERLLPFEYWVDTFKPAAAFRFNDDHDYGLIWRY